MSYSAPKELLELKQSILITSFTAVNMVFTTFSSFFGAPRQWKCLLFDMGSQQEREQSIHSSGLCFYFLGADVNN